MLRAKDFQLTLLDIKCSIAEFSRKSGIKEADIAKYCRDGVPDKKQGHVLNMISNAKKAIFFGKQMDIEDY